MSDRPIIFSGPMVRAMLGHRKTQTRRIVKPQPASHQGKIEWSDHNPGWWIVQGDVSNTWSRVRCPYGVPGDRLWVRETWTKVAVHPDGGGVVGYRADPAHAEIYKDYRWRPSIYMPRWASRLTLEITDVRVQRLQEISEEDAMAEGCERVPKPIMPDSTYRLCFERLWQSINAKRAPWASNPWVWAVTFRKVKP